ncbi:hypothetical protein PVAND_014809 [Polypedilum vanderplanki]|uniref:IBB domain-containing protein n=1 Tax=Polypedilum vanderplanki TaxID=319348 RepID=A0A9J6BAU3_POLVA|nr:hypothetical protein PVAND_014809 [Polypedilum vanderplanki]
MSSQSQRFYSVRSRLNNDNDEKYKKNNFNNKFRSNRSNFEDSHDRRDEKPKEIREFKDLRQLLNSRRNKVNNEATEKVNIKSRLDRNKQTTENHENLDKNSRKVNQNSLNLIEKPLNSTKSDHCDRTLKFREEISQKNEKIEVEEKKEERVRKAVRIRNPAGRLADLVRLQVVDAVQKNQKQITSSSSSHESKSTESLIEISSASSTKSNEEEMPELKLSHSLSSESLDKSNSKNIKITLKDFLLRQNVEKIAKNNENWLDMIDDDDEELEKPSEEKTEEKSSIQPSDDSKDSKKDTITKNLTKSSSEKVLNSHTNDQKILSHSAEQISKLTSFSNNFKEFYPRNYRPEVSNTKFTGSLSNENVNVAPFSHPIHHCVSQNSIYHQQVHNFNFMPQVHQNFYQIPPQITIPSYEAKNYNNFQTLPLISPTFSNRSDSPTNSISSLNGGQSKLEARLKKIRGQEEKKVKEIPKSQPQFSPQNLEKFDRNYQNHENLISIPIQNLSPKNEIQNQTEEFQISHHDFNLSPFVNDEELKTSKIKLESDTVEPVLKEVTANQKLNQDQLINLYYVTTLSPKYFGEAMNYYLEYYEELGIKLNQNEIENILKLRGKNHKINDDGLKILG